MKRKLLLTTFLLLNSSLAHGKTLNFNDALKEIRLRSTDLPPAQANVEAAEHDHLSKQLTFLPSLSAGYSKGENLETSVSTDSLFIKAHMNLFNGLKDISQLNASKFNLFATKAILDQETLSVESKATRAIVDFLQKSMDQKIFIGLKKSKEKSLT